MATEGPYEIVPIDEFNALKQDIDTIKRKYDKPVSDNLVDSLSQLTKNMSEMMQVFKIAADQIKNEEIGSGSSAKLMDKLDKIMEQNQTIAEALVQMNEMITTDVDKLLHRLDQTEKVFNQPKMKMQKRPEMQMQDDLTSSQPQMRQQDFARPLPPPDFQRMTPPDDFMQRAPPSMGLPQMGMPMQPQPMQKQKSPPLPPSMPYQQPSMQPPQMPSPGYAPQNEPQLDLSDLENLPEMPPLNLEEQPKKEGMFSKLFHKK